MRNNTKCKATQTAKVDLYCYPSNQWVNTVKETAPMGKVIGSKAEMAFFSTETKLRDHWPKIPQLNLALLLYAKSKNNQIAEMTREMQRPYMTVNLCWNDRLRLWASILTEFEAPPSATPAQSRLKAFVSIGTIRLKTNALFGLRETVGKSKKKIKHYDSNRRKTFPRLILSPFESHVSWVSAT